MSFHVKFRLAKKIKVSCHEDVYNLKRIYCATDFSGCVWCCCDLYCSGCVALLQEQEVALRWTLPQGSCTFMSMYKLWCVAFFSHIIKHQNTSRPQISLNWC